MPYPQSDQRQGANPRGSRTYDHVMAKLGWPRGQIVAVIRRGGDQAALAVLDVDDPAHARIARNLWRRGPELNLLPRWPIYEPRAKLFLFVGVEWPERRSLYSLFSQPEHAGSAHRAETRSRTTSEGSGFPPAAVTSSSTPTAPTGGSKGRSCL